VGNRDEGRFLLVVLLRVVVRQTLAFVSILRQIVPRGEISQKSLAVLSSGQRGGSCGVVETGEETVQQQKEERADADADADADTEARGEGLHDNRPIEFDENATIVRNKHPSSSSSKR